jgi:hypothetical protein
VFEPGLVVFLRHFRARDDCRVECIVQGPMATPTLGATRTPSGVQIR